MSLLVLEKFVPAHSISFIAKWLKPYVCHIKITRKRSSKLGDYRKISKNNHQISVNGDLNPELFFFVLTHEIAHLIAFESNKNISPHGKEWKECYRNLLLESNEAYSMEFRPYLYQYLKSPKANFMASPEIVKYFRNGNTNEVFVEELDLLNCFEYQKQPYKVLEKRRKHYLCKNLISGRKYLFRACAQVKKIENEE